MVADARPWKRQKAGGKQDLPILVMLDMNGVLLLRESSKRDLASLRPFIRQFMRTLFEDLADTVQVAVWSSMMKHNLHPLVEQAFGKYAGNLAFVWDQQWCTQKWVPTMRKPLLRKDLKWLAKGDGTPWGAHVPDRVILIDDDPVKCTENPEGTAIHPSTWAGSKEGKYDTELKRLSEYLKELAVATADPANRSVREYIRRHPFAEFQVESTRTSGNDEEEEEETGDANAWANDADCEEMGEVEDDPWYDVGDEVEAWWPDEESWLSATVLGVEDSSIKVQWAADHSESDLPYDYVQKRAPRQSPWKRVESRNTPGAFYYYNTKTGISQSETP